LKYNPSLFIATNYGFLLFITPMTAHACGRTTENAHLLEGVALFLLTIFSASLLFFCMKIIAKLRNVSQNLSTSPPSDSTGNAR
jgi:hypothetical protein